MKAKYYSTTELAKKIGISRQVLSAILNDKWKEKRISEATYLRTKEAIEELGYVPNKTAVSLKKSSQDLIGIVYHGPLHSHILIAIQKLNYYFHSHGIAVKIVSSQTGDLKEAIQDLMGDRVQNMIILLSSVNDDFSGNDLKQRPIQQLLKAIPNIIYNFPFDIHEKDLQKRLIAGGSQLIGFSRPSIYQEFFNALIAQKKTRILIDQEIYRYLSGTSDIENTLGKFQIVETFPSPKFKDIDQNRYLIGEKLGTKLLPKIKKHTFDYIISESDMIAQGIATSLSKANIRIPDKINIIGFDNIEASPYFKIPLTTIEVPVDQMVNNVIKCLNSNAKKGHAKQSKAKLIYQTLQG